MVAGAVAILAVGTQELSRPVGEVLKIRPQEHSPRGFVPAHLFAASPLYCPVEVALGGRGPAWLGECRLRT